MTEITRYTVQVDDVIEIATEQYGQIKAFVVREIKSTGRDAEDPRFRNSKYLALRPIQDSDTLKEFTTRDGDIVFRCVQK